MKRSDKGVYKRKWKNAKGEVVVSETWHIEWFEGDKKCREATEFKSKSDAVRLRAYKIANYDKEAKEEKAKLKGDIELNEFVVNKYLPKIFTGKIKLCLEKYEYDIIQALKKTETDEELNNHMLRLKRASSVRKLKVAIIHHLRALCPVITDSEAAKTVISSIPDPLEREMLYIMRFKMMELRGRVDVFRLVSERFGEKFLNNISGEDVKKYRDELVDLALAASTRNKRCGLIKHIFTIAHELKYVTAAKLMEIRIDKQEKEDNERFVETTPEERAKILEVAKKTPFMWELMCFSMFSGLRQNIEFRLRWDQVFIDEEVPYYSIDRDKNNAGSRVPLSPQAIEVLKCRSLVKNDSVPWVFYNPRTLMPYDNVDKAFLRIMTEAGRPDILWHDLRHIFCTMVADAGAVLPDLMSVSGHKDPKMAMRYINRSLKNKSSIVSALS